MVAAIRSIRERTSLLPPSLTLSFSVAHSLAFRGGVKVVRHTHCLGGEGGGGSGETPVSPATGLPCRTEHRRLNFETVSPRQLTLRLESRDATM